MLRKQFPLPSVDDAMGFDAPTHTYTCDGVPVPRSATAVVAALFPKFKPRKTVNTYFGNWRASGKSKYQAVIATSFDDAEAKAAIVAGWANDTTARDRGTLVHKCVEDLLNGVAVDAEVRASVEPELGGFERFLGTAAGRRTGPSSRSSPRTPPAARPCSRAPSTRSSRTRTARW